jgi:kynurenine formamidase
LAEHADSAHCRKRERVNSSVGEPNLPAYDSLPAGPIGGRLGWGIFGSDDETGLVNLLTPDVVRAAAKLVKRGVSFPLDMPVGAFDPPLNGNRRNPTHELIRQPGGIGFDDRLDDFYPQAASQWDSLAHVGYTADLYYNGVRDEEIPQRRLTIDHWGRRGIVGRGVLLDLVATMAALDRAYDPGSATEFGVTELEAARRMSGITYSPGDVILLHTGFSHWYSEQPLHVREQLPGDLHAPGLEHSEDVCRYLWDSHVAAIASDTFAVEAWPTDTGQDAAPFSFIHQMLIGSFGMALGELWWLADLAADCQTTGVYEGMLVSVPMNMPGGIGSPANAILLK